MKIHRNFLLVPIANCAWTTVAAAAADSTWPQEIPSEKGIFSFVDCTHFEFTPAKHLQETTCASSGVGRTWHRELRSATEIEHANLLRYVS